METFNPDPKPGRIVLPLVLIGMIATTYTFINRVATNNDLDIVVEETTVQTLSEETTEDTTTTTTTTTLPDDYISYLEEINGERIVAISLGEEVLQANDEFDVFIAKWNEFVDTISNPGPPSTYANLVTSHEELKTLVTLVYEDTVELKAGLESSDTGERRAAALNSFNDNLDQLINKISEIVATASS